MYFEIFTGEVTIQGVRTINYVPLHLFYSDDFRLSLIMELFAWQGKILHLEDARKKTIFHVGHYVH